jgi:probable rRNA maturation factor
MELVFVNKYGAEFDYIEPIFLRLLNKAKQVLSLKDNYILEVNLLTSNEIIILNNQYRNLNEPTDVLSFAFLETSNNEVVIKNSPFINLGMIVISVDHALLQADDKGYTIIEELAFLFVHGLLHLLGYHHDDDQQEQKMIAIQQKIITKEVIKG